MELNLDSIKEARSILEGNIEKTPIYTASRMNDNLYIKMENLQKTGSFKLRGAFNKIAHLTEEEAKRGVISCSAGNHAQGVALSATKQGIKSYICIPSVAPLSKIEATRGYGGEVIIVDGTFDDAQKRAFELEKERNLTYVAPFDDEYVIAGQGTIGLEILEQLPDVKYIVVPIGGGGLISGIALAVKSIKPDVKIIGVEPESAASMYESRKAGKLVTLDSVKTMADGIAVKRPGNITFDLVEKYVDDIVTVSEDEITNAILRLLEESKVASEGAGASSIAAVLHGKYDFSDGKVCAVLSGGNININTISQIINQGLFKTGRLAEITTIISDNPGELIRLLTIIKDLGANIMAIDQFKSSETVGFDHAVVRIIAETYNEDHRKELYKTLADKGYQEIHGKNF
ncbi:threonine ammonia-lyase [Anaerococcus sp. AGMB09787]|uniref:threonine ammonia-lyase n=1 Tax=Anaerococcus sp. AGMB09787 TaxID=2922869 RepID=UPI001FB04327|nr:threonine ammonia-lyase [Anaerococcus sp. AGMB09787]